MKLEKKKEGLLIILLFYTIESTKCQLFVGLHCMSELVNFHKETFFAKDCLEAQVKILKSKNMLQSVSSNSVR